MEKPGPIRPAGRARTDTTEALGFRRPTAKEVAEARSWSRRISTFFRDLFDAEVYPASAGPAPETEDPNAGNL